MDTIHETLDDAIIQREELEKCFKLFDVSGINKVDITELSSAKESANNDTKNETLEEMQNSKWATSNHLFDYNTFINDFYNTLDEYKHKLEEKAPEVLSSIKGSFFFNGENVISHQYSMVLSQSSHVKIGLEIDAGFDCEIYIFVVRQEKNEITYKFVEKSSLLISGHGEEGKTVFEGPLDKGVYILIPSTTGCLFQKRKHQPSSDVHLTHEQSGEIRLGEPYKMAISQIFHQLDIDESGTLSRAQFNLYNWRTSGAELTDEDWRNLVNKLKITDDEMSLEQFIHLHQLEAKSGESVELWMALWTMGFNHNLEQDESFNFKILVTSQLNPLLKLYGLRSGGGLLEKATITYIMDGADKLYAGSHQQIILYLKTTHQSMSVVAQNCCGDDQSVELDFSKSQNAIINHPHKKFTIHLPKSSVLFLAHLIKRAEDLEFLPKLTVKSK